MFLLGMFISYLNALIELCLILAYFLAGLKLETISILVFPLAVKYNF